MSDAIHPYEPAEGHGLADNSFHSIVGFSSIGAKSRLRDIGATGEFE